MQLCCHVAAEVNNMNIILLCCKAASNAAILPGSCRNYQTCKLCRNYTDLPNYILLTESTSHGNRED